MWKAFMKGLSWSLGDGKRITFWLGCWLPDGLKLINVATVRVHESMINDTLEKYVTSMGRWNWQIFWVIFQLHPSCSFLLHQYLHCL